MSFQPNGVVSMENQTNTNNNGGNEFNPHEMNPFTSFKSMLGAEIDEDNNWYLPMDNHHENNVAYSSLLNPNFDVETAFDLPVNNGPEGLPEFGEFGSQTQMGASNLIPGPQFSTTHFTPTPGNGFGFPGLPGLGPLEYFASNGARPTLFQKRTALSLNSINTNNGDDFDNLSFDGSGLNYDSDDLTEMTESSKLEEIGIRIGDNGDTSNGNSTVTGAGAGEDDRKGKKKGGGEPAKNLMAERRRRKKLNDRLFMLRSVVPRISKMDRASILGDAIEYLKDLLQRVSILNQELESMPSSSSAGPAAANGFYPLTPSRPSLPPAISDDVFSGPPASPTVPPMRVEVVPREGGAVTIHMFCGKKPGVLLSTLRTLDDLGIDIHQAVISCFNGFALDVFLAEICNEGRVVQPDQIKAMLLEAVRHPGLV